MGLVTRATVTQCFHRTVSWRGHLFPQSSMPVTTTRNRSALDGMASTVTCTLWPPSLFCSTRHAILCTSKLRSAHSNCNGCNCTHTGVQTQEDAVTVIVQVSASVSRTADNH